jgi:hypothetical protein
MTKKPKVKKERKFFVGKYDPPSSTFQSAEEWQALKKRVRQRWRKANPILVRQVLGGYGTKNGG